ncbi:MAG: hypothetical protein VX246_02475 [Myxococcota bacterium]|nr:hypothetical protein [Myxococcota bacterium]
MDVFFELLGDPAYRHVLLNHLPLTGLGVAWLVLLAGLATRQIPTILIALGAITLISAATFFVGQAGDDAYPAVFDALDGHGREWLDYHTYLADKWLPIVYANAGVSILAICAALKRAEWTLAAAGLVAATTLAALGTAAWIAEAGGKIQHPEFRFSDVPDYEAPKRLR